MASAIVLGLLIFGVVVGPWFWPVAINDIDFSATLQGPSLAHPFGTDDLGQDLLARMMYGGRISLAVGLAAMVVATCVGVVVGALAGMSRKYADPFLMWVTDLFLSLPQLPLLLLIIYLFREQLKAVFGVEGGVFVLIVVVIGGLRWMPVARLVRAQFLSLREKEFVDAARSVGVPSGRIIFRHILPNTVGVIIVSATLAMSSAILLESALSFLGFGVQAPNTSLGQLINNYRSAMGPRPWLFWWPGLFIVAIALAVNFIGDGLRDAFDPRQNRQKA